MRLVIPLLKNLIRYKRIIKRNMFLVCFIDTVFVLPNLGVFCGLVKRDSLTKCLRLANDFNGRCVLFFIHVFI